MRKYNKCKSLGLNKVGRLESILLIKESSFLDGLISHQPAVNHTGRDNIINNLNIYVEIVTKFLLILVYIYNKVEFDGSLHTNQLEKIGRLLLKN